jgi:hypothetical protein
MFKSGASIRPLSITQDSRCPKDVECIQAGTVEVSLKTSYNGQSSMHEIALGQSVTIGGTRITFASASPQKNTSAAISASAYRLTFVAEPASSATLAPCYVGGCSNELCTDQKGQVSACLYSSSYACYRTATCERQSDGACGWTQTPALAKCLANPPSA